jgi:hypothetical protein
MVPELSLKQVLQRGLPGHPLEAVNLRFTTTPGLEIELLVKQTDSPEILSTPPCYLCSEGRT